MSSHLISATVPDPGAALGAWKGRSPSHTKRTGLGAGARMEEFGVVVEVEMMRLKKPHEMHDRHVATHAELAVDSRRQQPVTDKSGVRAMKGYLDYAPRNA